MMTQILKNLSNRYYNISDNNITALAKKRQNFYYCGSETEADEIKEDSIFSLSYDVFCAKVIPAIKNEEYNYHFLTLGFSLQPIIWSILSINAPSVVLLYSEETRILCSEIESLMKKINDFIIKKGKIPVEYSFIGKDTWGRRDIRTDYKVNSSDPDKVYNVLASLYNSMELSKEKGKVALSISGGKKSTVMGAYIFALHHKWDTYYVDFGAYDIDNPVFGSEVFTKLNPVSTNTPLSGNSAIGAGKPVSANICLDYLSTKVQI